MTAPRISALLREQVRRRAGDRCEYCQTLEWLSGLACETDHILPRAHGGTTTLDNLCLACPSCNGHKQARTHGLDPLTGEAVRLFHPRTQAWRDHFDWSEGGLFIVGRTACGRATVEALRLNHDRLVRARQIWVFAGLWPPLE